MMLSSSSSRSIILQRIIRRAYSYHHHEHFRRAQAGGGGGGRNLLIRSIIGGSSSSSRPVLSAAAAAEDGPHQKTHSSTGTFLGSAVSAAALLLLAAATGTTTAACDSSSSKKKQKQPRRHRKPSELSPSHVAKDAPPSEDNADSEDFYNSLPIYTSDQVAQHNGQDSSSGEIWMTYGGIVYNVTDFIPNHPGGSEKIIQAAGSAIEPYWHLYRQHFASDLPLKLMEHMVIGRLAEEDQAMIDEGLEALSQDDPYAQEPSRHRSLIVHSDQPMNAEVPASILTNSYLTPNSLFYIRHHHPVPYLADKQLKNYKVSIDCSAFNGTVLQLSLEDLKKLPSKTITATLQCSGNRRSGYNLFQRTSGTPWDQGAISTAQFTGVPLKDLLQLAGVEDPVSAEEQGKMEHVRFTALDGMMASIPMEKACNPYGDVLVCYEMNGEPLPREHGFPLRVLVPGYAAVRNVKWLQRIELATTEAEGPWQQGLNYKTLPPNVTDAKNIDLASMPSMTEVSVFSGITKMEPQQQQQQKSSGSYNNHNNNKPGDRVPVKVYGWAWAGGGRNIVRVDVTGDGGKTWNTAELLQGKEQKFGRAWAWTFWECTVPDALVNENGTIQIASKAVDLAFNVQPESPDHSWNVRGLGNNSWYKAEIRV
jgi:sulfite oxidase